MGEKQNEVVKEIHLSDISSFPDHPYQIRDDDSMNELVESVKERGLIQPVIVRPVDGGYEMVSGHRRKRAYELAGIEKIPARISEKAAVSSFILSNIQYAVTGDNNALDVCAIDKTISDLQTDSMRIMSLCSQTGGSTERYETELQKIFEKIQVLREQRELAVQQAKENEAETSEIQRITRLISSGNISFDEFNDVTVHHLIECIRVMRDKTIEILFKDGSTVCEKI